MFPNTVQIFCHNLSPETIKNIPFCSAILWSRYDLVLWYIAYFLKWREKETNCDEGEPRQGYRLSSLSCILPKLLVKGINIHIPVFFSWFSGMSRVLGVNKDRKPRYAVSFTAHKTLEIFLEDRWILVWFCLKEPFLHITIFKMCCMHWVFLDVHNYVSFINLPLKSMRILLK